jgi:hypothetical protein
MRPKLGHEAERDVEQEGDADRGGVEGIAGGQGDGGGHEQQQHDRTAELVEQDAPAGDGRSAAEEVWTIPGQPLGGLGFGQPRRAAAEPG